MLVVLNGISLLEISYEYCPKLPPATGGAAGGAAGGAVGAEKARAVTPPDDHKGLHAQRVYPAGGEAGG